MPQQFRLLLWKDFLIRKRKLITLAGVLWATIVVSSLFIVRVNIDNVDYPTCYFPARALPSAGMIPFLQSLICGVNNDCLPPDQYEEIPTYENSTLTQMQRKFVPILYNETVMEVAATVPDALKLLATLSEVADEPTFIQFTKKGLRVSDLFKNPGRVENYLASYLDLPNDVAESLMTSQLNLEGIMKSRSKTRTCSSMIEGLLTMPNQEHMRVLTERMCGLSGEKLQGLMGVILEIDFSKFIRMAGNMFYKLKGDDRVIELADTVTAMLRMVKLESFIPAELAGILGKKSDFSYFDVAMITKFMDLFKPTFADTETYKNIKEISDAMVAGAQYLDKVLSKRNTNNTVEDTVNFVSSVVESKGFNNVSTALTNVSAIFKERNKDAPLDVFKILSPVTNFIYKWLPNDTKHDVLLYSTLLAKLVECANRVLDINMSIEERAYNASLRHPKALKTLEGLSELTIDKGFKALADANRIMMITQRIDDPGRIFCDDNQLQTFFNVSAADAADLKNKLCNDDWKNYMSDLIKGFGVYEVKDRINDMASILIQETLGKDTSSRLYTIDKDFEILKVFVESLSTMKSPPKFDWMTLFNVRNDSRFTMAVRRNSFMAKRILITIHGALAREVIKQNTILSFKLTSPLLDTMTLVTAINRQLAKTPSSLTDRVKKAYPDILKVIFSTALKEEKTYAALSTPGLNMLCNGVEHASSYIELPQDTNKEELVETLCDITRAIESGFEIDSDFGQGIDAVRNSKHTPFDNVPWPALVTAVKNLYVKLDQDYPYLFEYSTFGMNNETRENMTVMIEEGMKYWFGNDTWTRSMHLSIKLVLRILDLLDRDIFDMRSETWLKVKYTLSGVSGPIEVMDDLIWSIKAAHFHEDTLSKLPSNTVGAITHIIPHLPQLVYETLEIVQNDTTHVTEVISLINEENWPCSTTSLGQVLRLGPGPAAAVRHIEGLMCMSNDERNQWKAYLDAKGVGGFNLKNWNQTYPPHVFLRFSSALDSLINDSTLLVNLARSVDTDDVTGVLGSHYDVSGIVGTNYRELRESWRKVGDKIKEIMNSSERDAIFRNFFRKLDAVINAVNTTHSPTNLSLNALWAVYNNCSGSPNIDESCRMLGRDVWKYSLEFFSVMCENVARDLLKYFREINEPHASVLQIAGFTRGTPLFEMYAALPNYIAVLVNSYWDHKFMSQVHRASQINFWDCEAVVDAMRPAPGSPVTGQALQAIKPYVCPSVLYWLSLPRGDNTLLDVIAKPQYFLYTLHVENFTSSYENGYNSITELNYYLADLANEKKIKVTENEISFNSIEGLMKNLVDNITDYKISKNDEFYKTFSDTNEKQFAATLYLARVVSMINKIAIRVENLNLTPELRFIQNMFKRKPNEAISLHFDLITEMVFSGRYSLVEMFNSTCNNLTMKRFIIDSSDRLRKQICSKNYEVIYRNIDSGFEEDYDNASKSLLNLVNILQNGASDNITDIFEFLNRRTELVNYMSNSVEYSYELGIPVYLKYLMNQLHHYDVILTFLSGGDWWKELRSLYHGPYAAKFFDSVEKSFEIVMDLFNNLDEIHLVRFLRDINLNDSDIFCNASISVSDYFPDKTGLFSDMKQRMCAEDKGSIYAEILSLTFAAQGYNADLKLSKTINDTALNIIISSTESKLQKLLEKGPQDPQRPPWVTDEEINDFKQAVVGLISKETLTKIMFGLVSNVADAGTLFLNDSQCAVCSHLTSWFKLLNLQVVKKQEYDTLLCHMDAMTLEDVHHVLKNDFHWHMAIQELISTRNYTHLELNKAVQEFLEVVKLHLLEDLNSQSTKISGCLARNVSKNALGNATLFITVLAHTARLLRSELPHLQEVDGIKDVPYLKQMEAAIAHRLVVAVPLKKILLDMKLEDKDIIGGEILNSGVRFGSITDLDQPLSVILPNIDWGTVCKERDCKKLANTLNRNINRTVLENELLTLKSEQFWSFNFLSNILYHIEALLGHSTGLLGVASKVDLAGVMRGRLEALVDFMVQLMVEDTMNEVLYSIQGLSKELHPLLEGASLEYDLGALGRGLAIVQQFKDYLLENEYLKIKVSEFYPDREAIEQPLHRLGINNTNFWSLAAPRIYIGHIDLTPIFSQKQGDFHISNYVCSIEEMSNVIAPGDLDVVTGDDVFGAVAEQFCGLTDRQAKEMLPALVQGLDLTAVFDKLKSMILPQLYEASNLTRSEGDLVMERYPRMVALLPTIQGSVGELTESLAREPLVKELSGFNSVGGLLGSSDIISNVGRMVCGKRLEMKENRLYNAITSSKDFSTDFNQAEIDRLPTEFCREMYRDILRMQGGKIVWSFIKPMIMGKILYTPSNPVTEMIMQKANSSFATMIRLTTMVHSFAGSLPALDKVSSHREGVAALRAAMASLGPGLGAEVPTGNVSGLFEDIGDFKDIGSVLKKGSDLLRCFDLNRFRTVPDEFELTHQAVKLTLVNEFSAGIVFLNTEGKEDLPKNIEYKIRMDVDNVPTTARLRNYLWVPGPEASFLEDMRYFRGFVHIQDMLDTAIIQLSRSSSRREKRETRTEDESKWAVYTQQEPYPCYRKDFFQTSLYESQALLVAFFFSLLFTVSSVVRFNVQEKETGNTMLMSVMGVNLSYHTLSWFVASSLEVAATCCCMCAVLALGGVLPQTSGTLLLALLLIMGFSTLSFCYMLSKFFTSASFGAVCSAIAYLVTFMPVVLILSLEAVLTNILKLFVCLSMSSAICYSFLYVARFEAMGKGAQWEDIFTGIDGEDMSIAAGAIMALVDAVIYFAIGYLVDRYTGVRAVQSNITTYTATDEKAGVSIINVSKTYRGRWRGQDRLALDNVSIELHKGQITALLGHNGAGKTTLINILTGMLKPTKGDVIVRSEAGATRVGVCAQRDVLHAQLTAYEHVVLYAQLKSGKRLDELQDEVDSILRALSLGAVAHEPVAQLSGGTRRRLCVALAFVARPQLVSLDEPTSGVDPAARSILRVLSLGAVAHEPVAQLSGGTRRRLCVALAFVARPQLVSLDEPTSGVDPAARSILRVLSLGAVAHEPVAQLSGGTRRRLCVALAFVARPQLVSLDEPTSGVDPAARRDIWSMIVKLREDRTILMTTHHLDEAELLSDQIVIMHKGQIHTTGSPIEIKRSLGNGYKLTVSYPPSTEDSEEVSIEERSKQLMSVVRNSVKNASLVDASGLDVEIGLPFFDGNGLNNNFLHLCTSVEASQQALGYRGYSLDCSSLEQVFFNICHQADGQPNQAYEFDPDMPSHSTHSTSSASVRSNTAPLVPMQGPLKGSSWHQFTALLHARYLHYIRNRWLLFLLLVLPALFVGLAMAFSLVRPPADNEIPLTLNPALYRNSTQYLIPKPSDSSKIMDTSFAESVMERLRHNKKYRNWTSEDTPDCKCGERRQECDLTEGITRYRPEMMLLPNASTLNEWIVASHDAYIEKRYGGYSSSVKNNVTNFIVWYNNKGHHALPAFLSAMSSAILGGDVTITAHAHTLKISREQLTKDTVYQHVADAGISALVLIAYSLVSAGGAIYLVSARRSQEKRLQLLCGVSPAVYWGAALASDMIIILINLVITVILFESFGFPVFVARNNLLAICLLIVLFGYACASLVHVAEKLFSEASMANMVLFTGNAFLGLAGITLLLILDIISESDTTDNARWALHKVFLLSPQFALGDGLLEIAKNTIQAQVLDRFGMDTYKDPLSTPLVAYHYIALVLVGTALLALNLAIEYDCFHDLWLCIRPQPAEEIEPSEMEDVEVAAERKRVVTSLARDKPLRISTIGNINAGYVDTEEMKERPRTQVMPSAGGDACHCVGLSKVYPSLSGPKVAVKSLTLGIPTGQCTALLGQNGAGKSTTFAMLTGQERPTAGRIYLNDCQVGSRQLCSGLISYCPQSDAIDPLLTVRETLQMYCRLRGITDQEQVIKRTIEMFDLTKYAGARNGTLSGGNKRKLCTAIAFMGRTPLVLLDEPTSGMDPGSRGCVARGATCACAARRAVLLSTHALRDARRLAGRVALLRAGTLAALASVDDCLTRFGGGYVVSCRVRGGAARAVWRRVLQRAPHATLQVLHHATINFLVPVHATVDGKEITTSLSDIFRLMAELQTTCDIEDFTVNQSSLDQMFLSFSDKTEEDLDMSEYESAPQTPSCDTLNTPL